MKCTLLAMVLTLCALPAQAKVTTLQLPADARVRAGIYEDLNGDGRRDLLVATSSTAGGRTVRVHYAGDDGSSFRQTPDLVAPVPASVSAFAVGDVHPDPGPEIVWFGGRGAYAWRPKAADAEREVKLCAASYLYQYPDPQRLLNGQASLVDLNGDGRIDLVLPEPDGYRLAIQGAPGKGFTTVELRIPVKPADPNGPGKGPPRRPLRGERRGRRFEVGASLMSADARPRAPLVSIRDAVPAPQLHDWDGDGDLDVLAKSGEQVMIWLQGPGGVFPGTASTTLQFPLTDQQTRLDPRFSATLTDFNRDRKVDAVVVAKDARSEELRTQVMFFPQTAGAAPLFAKGRPSQLLILAGFTSPPMFQDIDGDGSVDLAITSWRLDVLDQLASRDKKLEVEIYVYLNQRGRFSRRPDLSHREALDGGMLQKGGSKLFARFFGDVTGDGVRELLVRDQPERLRLLMVRKNRGKLQLLPKPIWELRIDAEADILRFDGPAGDRGFLVREAKQLLLVKF